MAKKLRLKVPGRVRIRKKFPEQLPTKYLRLPLLFM